jgi:nucleoside-diphosphate kinase
VTGFHLLKQRTTDHRQRTIPAIDLVISVCYGTPKLKKGDFKRIMERTLAIIKPDGVSRGLIGEVIKRLESSDFKIMAMKMVHLSKKQAEGFYAVHQGKPFFKSLTDFMSSGPAVVMILEGENVIARYRELMGATNYREAAAGTIRKEFATDIEKNIVHGSDAPDTAAFEMAYFFNRLEIID